MNTIATNASFESRLKERIKDSIGTLLTDEDLSKLVHRSLEEIFFTERPNPKRTYSYSSEPEKLPPLLHDIVKECMQSVVTKAVSNWMTDHCATVNKTLEHVVTQGIGNAVLQAMNTQLQTQLFTFQQNVITQLQANRS